MAHRLTKFYKYIRSFLLLTIIINIGFIFHYKINPAPGYNVAIQEDVSFRLQLIFVAVITFTATFLPSYLENQKGIQFPEILEITIIIFILAAGYLSQSFNLFVRFFWWDDVLHFTSGTFIAIAGFLLIYKLNHRFSFDLNPWLIAIFTFSFSVTAAVFWEIGEFISDWFLQTNYQKWNVPVDTPLMGKAYQGLALRDTMADLIIASAGALLISILAFFAVNTKKEETLRKIEKFVGDEKKPKDENDAKKTTNV